jgi:deoxyadenosine/deoxycytidine kinase
MIFTIEGNIGSGKTTILKEIESLKFAKRHIVVFEQVKEWSDVKDESGTDILSLFYKDKSKYSYIFQSYVLFSRIHHLLDTIQQNPNSIVICERSHFTDLYVFAKTLYESKDISDIEWKVYNIWHTKIRELLSITITGIIYIQTDPLVCYNRIKIRSRTGEDCIPIEYLQTLHNRHDDWLIKRPVIDSDKKWFSVHKDSVIPVVTLDGNVDVYDYSNRTKQLDLIIEFVNYYVKSN